MKFILYLNRIRLNVSAIFFPKYATKRVMHIFSKVRIKTLKEKEYKGSMAAILGGDGSVATNGFWSALTFIYLCAGLAEHYQVLLLV